MSRILFTTSPSAFASIFTLIALNFLSPKAGNAQSITTTIDQFIVTPGMAIGSIEFDNASNPCSDFTIQLKALNAVNGMLFDTWLYGRHSDDNGEIILLGTSSGPVCIVTLPTAPAIGSFPVLQTGPGDCYYNDATCANPALMTDPSCMKCMVPELNLNEQEIAGGYKVCATLMLNGVATSSQKIFFFCFKRAILPQIDASYQKLSHSCDDGLYVDDIPFNSGTPESFRGNSIYFHIKNGNGNYSMTPCPGETIPAGVHIAPDAGNPDYWKVSLDDGVWVDGMPHNLCFRLQETPSRRDVLAVDSRTNDIRVTICNRASAAPKGPDDVIFVIDKSGSMNDDLNGLSKYDALKIVFSSIIDGWKEIDPQDQMGVVLFNTSKDPLLISNEIVYPISEPSLYAPASPSCFNLPEWLIVKKVCDIVPEGATSLGAGMQSAVKMLLDENNTHRKQIILLTDGEQNWPPYVTSEENVDENGFAFFGGWGISILNEDVYAYSGPQPLMVKKDGGGNFKFKTGDERPNIKVHVGAFGQQRGGAYGKFLTKLAGDSGGLNRFFDGDEATIGIVGEIFQNELHQLFEQTQAIESPRRVYSNVGSFSNGIVTNEFNIAGEYSFLQVTTGNVADNNVYFEKIEMLNSANSWIDLLSIAPVTSVKPANNVSSPYRIFTIDLNQLPGVSAGNRMRITTRSISGNANYFLKVLVDDLSIKFRSGAARNNISAGEGMPLKVNIFQKDNATPSGFKPITPALGGRARAIIRRPEKSYSRLFAETNLPRKYVLCSKSGNNNAEAKTSGKGNNNFVCNYILSDDALKVDHETGNNYLEKKFRILLDEKDYYTKVKTIEEEVELIHRGSGVYTASFNDTKNSGDYQIEFLINGPGNFARTSSETAVVDFAKPELKTSTVRLQSENTLILGFKPRDIYKNYLGANRTKTITMHLSNGVVGPLSDYMNGRYVTGLSGKKVRYKNNLTIQVLNQTLYSGKLWKLLHRYTFATQAGIAFPTGDFKNNYQRNYFLEGKFGVRLVTGLFLQFEGSYYNFKNKADFSDLNISGGGLGLQYNFPIKPGSGWNLYLDGNLGYYKPDNQDAAIGFSGALGITKTIRPNLALVLEGKYRHINTSPEPITFAAGSLGLRYSFSELFPKNKVPCKCTDCRFFLIPSCISLNYGRAFATGDTKNNYADGSLYEVGLNYPVVNDFKIVAEGGYYQLKGESNAGDISMYRAGLGFYANFGSNRIIPTIGGSLGYYWPDNIDAGFGIKTTGGLRFPISSKSSDIKRFTILVDGNYYRIFGKTSDVEFLGLSGGITYCF